MLISFHDREVMEKIFSLPLETLLEEVPTFLDKCKFFRLAVCSEDLIVIAGFLYLLTGTGLWQAHHVSFVCVVIACCVLFLVRENIQSAAMDEFVITKVTTDVFLMIIDLAALFMCF